MPKGLAETAIPFKYNSIEDLKLILDRHQDVGSIIIEGARYDLPSEEFLEGIQSEAKKRGILVIIDEITSGFRLTDSGVYRLFDFDPDIVIYGKALGNGFAISAVVGKGDVMSSAQDTFISSTMWTERVGFAAGIATLKKLARHKVKDHLIEIGTFIGEGWLKLGKKHDLKLTVTEFKPLIGFKLHYGDRTNEILTLFTQEMLKRKWLAASDVYVTYAHTKEIVNAYFEDVDQVFSIIAAAIKSNTVPELLEAEIRSDSFKRLT